MRSNDTVEQRHQCDKVRGAKVQGAKVRGARAFSEMAIVVTAGGAAIQALQLVDVSTIVWS